MVNWDNMNQALEEQKEEAQKLQDYVEKKLEELIQKVKGVKK